MGLGKTIMTIALLAHLAIQTPGMLREVCTRGPGGPEESYYWS